MSPVKSLLLTSSSVNGSQVKLRREFFTNLRA
jgi:hypothetical protein